MPITVNTRSRRCWKLTAIAVRAFADLTPVAPTAIPESLESAWESAATALGEEISAVEQAMIRGAIAAGKGKTETLQALKGYRGRRHRAYRAAWERAVRG